tara:strand:- start:8020 stop:8193 length:174 start_codon:yes stop_codon:yes gene_type:complete
MWVLVWIQFIPGVPVQYYQLNDFGNRTECEQYKEQAKIMATSSNTVVACLSIRGRRE